VAKGKLVMGPIGVALLRQIVGGPVRPPARPLQLNLSALGAGGSARSHKQATSAAESPRRERNSRAPAHCFFIGNFSTK